MATKYWYTIRVSVSQVENSSSRKDVNALARSFANSKLVKSYGKFARYVTEGKDIYRLDPRVREETSEYFYVSFCRAEWPISSKGKQYLKRAIKEAPATEWLTLRSTYPKYAPYIDGLLKPKKKKEARCG